MLLDYFFKKIPTVAIISGGEFPYSTFVLAIRLFAFASSVELQFLKIRPLQKKESCQALNEILFGL